MPGLQPEVEKAVYKPSKRKNVSEYLHELYSSIDRKVATTTENLLECFKPNGLFFIVKMKLKRNLNVPLVCVYVCVLLMCTINSIN